MNNWATTQPIRYAYKSDNTLSTRNANAARMLEKVRILLTKTIHCIHHYRKKISHSQLAHFAEGFNVDAASQPATANTQHNAQPFFFAH